MTKRDHQSREYANEAADIVTRLRDRAYSFKAPDPLLEEAANEIERLRVMHCDTFPRCISKAT